MSSILVKEMSMPTECEYCGFCRYYQENGRVWCNAKNRVLLTHWGKPDWTHLDIKRPDWCPLVEVKTPHGRLIDATALIKALVRKEPFNDCARVVIAECMEEVRHAPTVIEAEDET